MSRMIVMIGVATIIGIVAIPVVWIGRIIFIIVRGVIRFVITVGGFAASVIPLIFLVELFTFRFNLCLFFRFNLCLLLVLSFQPFVSIWTMM
jgi:hypothetical protein